MRQMKESGIGWVHEIPNNWNVIKGKYVFSNNKMVVGAKFEEFERLALTMKGVIKRSKDDTEGLQPDKFNTYQILKTDELVFKLIDLQNISTSRVGLSPYTGIVSPAYIILKGNTKICSKYAEKYYLMMWMNQVFNALGDSGVRSSLNASELLEIQLPLPPFDEQERIAAFLDKECSKIDSIYADVEKQIETLEQYKRSVITEAVTKGLNPNVVMKDSIIEFVDFIPNSWAEKPIRFLFDEITTKNYLAQVKNSLKFTYGNIVPKNNFDADTDDYVYATILNYTIVEPGMIMINCLNLNFDFVTQRIGLVRDKGVITSAYLAIKPKDSLVESRYAAYQLKYFDFVKAFHNMGSGVRKTLDFTELGKKYFILPSYNEQQAIAEYLDKKCAEIESVIADKKKQLEVLENYKKSLIYEYVTGKKEVVNE